MTDIHFLNTKSASRKATNELLIWSYVCLFSYLENKPSSSPVLSTIPRHHGETGSFYVLCYADVACCLRFQKNTAFIQTNVDRSSELVILT